MTISTWPEDINNSFFSFQKQPKENTVVSDFSSGRVSGYKKNSRQQFIYTLSVRFSKEEEALFWEWFEEIGTILGAFSCSALGTGYFRFVSIPSPQDTDQTHTTLELEIEDLY